MPVPQDPSEVAAAPAFDLFSLRGTIALLVIFFVAGLYALGEVFFVEAYLPVGGMPQAGFALAALIALSTAFMMSRGAPRAERAALALLLGLALTSAACPLMLRINQATATADLTVAEYRESDGGQYLAVDPAYPDIRFDARHTRLLAGSSTAGMRSFELSRGGLGFYQLDLQLLREELFLRLQLEQFVEELNLD